MLDINAGHQRWISTLDINAGYQRWISTLNINAGYQRWTSTLDINAGQGMIALPSTASRSRPIASSSLVGGLSFLNHR
jgi:hypothetical protein